MFNSSERSKEGFRVITCQLTVGCSNFVFFLVCVDFDEGQFYCMTAKAAGVLVVALCCCCLCQRVCWDCD